MSKPEHDSEERSLFRKAAAGARPMAQDRARPHRRGPKPIPKQRQRDEREVIESLLSHAYEPSEVESGEELLFARSGLQHSVLRKLRRGHYAVEAHLDLHGQTVAQAREAVSRFLHEARAIGKRCVRIVHGKGKSSTGKLPVLKGKVNAWLRQRDAVLAFSSCPPTDGGTGAVYVLLRRRD